MSSTDELQKMVLQFKVSDLQSLLSFAGQNKNGRKTELQKKALNLIQCRRSVPLEMKVRNIYRHLVAENAANDNRYDQYQSAFDKYNNYLPSAAPSSSSSTSLSNGYVNQPLTNGGGGAYHAYNTRNGYGGVDNYSNSYYGGNLWSRPTSNGYSNNNGGGSSSSSSTSGHHYSGSGNNININLSSGGSGGANSFRSSASKFDYASYLGANAKIPSTEELKHTVFKKLSFFNYKSCVHPPTPLVPRSEHSELFEFTLPFSLNPQQHSLINWAKKSGKESRYQIQLRICRLDEVPVAAAGIQPPGTAAVAPPSELSDSLPLALGVKVNDKNCQLPPAIPSTNKQGMLLKRMNAPINLTPQTRRSHVNNLVVYWSVECNQLYGFAIHLVEKYTADELIDELVKRGERDPQLTKNYLKAKLGGCGRDSGDHDDDEIAATSLKVSLLCPLGKIRMSLPARATTCDHLQCFDAALYLKMNEVKSTWQCPVCNKPCYYEDLFVDGFFADVMRKKNLGSDVCEIQIEADGSVIPIAPKKRGNSSSSPGSAAAAAAAASPKKRLRLMTADDEEPCKADSSLVKNRDPSPEDDCRRPPSQLAESSPPLPPPAPTIKKSFVDSSLPPFIPIFNSYSSSSFSRRRHNALGEEDEENDDDDDVMENSSSRNNGGVSASASSNDYCEQPKKNVVLVDLTETDSESDDDCCPPCSPLNLETRSHACTLSSAAAVASVAAPPVYDIDDSDVC